MKQDLVHFPYLKNARRGSLTGAVFLTIIFLLADVKAIAQSARGADTTAIEEVVVTGQYSENDPAKAVQRISIIDRKKIDAMAAQNLRDVLSNQLNIRLAQDNILGSSLSMQGVSGQNVKILIDGVPVVGRQDGNIDLAQINLHNVERIEMVEGPMSVNYGTDALGGTINLITKKTPKGKWEGGVNAYYETVGNYNINARAGIGMGRHSVMLNGGRNFFDGWNPDEKPSFDFSPRVADSSRVTQWKPKEQYQAGLLYAYTAPRTSYSFKSSYFDEKITNRGLPGYKMQAATDDYYYTNRFDNAVFVNGKLNNDHNFNIQVAYNTYKRVKNSYNNNLTNMKESLVPDVTAQDTTRFNTLNSRGTWSRNAQAAKLNYELGYEVNIETGEGIRIKDGSQQMGDYALYGSAEYRPGTNLTIRPGLRYAYNTAYKAPLIPSVNIRYKAGKNTTLRASYARGFRAPGLKELYFYFVDANHNIRGNEKLDAEYSHNFNASAVYGKKLDRFAYRLEAAGFYNSINNQIALAQVAGGGPTDFTYINVDQYRSKGAQLNAELRVKAVSVMAGVAVTGRYNAYASAYNVAEYVYTPEVQGNVSYRFGKTGITAALFGKYTGSLPSFETDTAGNIYSLKVQPFTIADLTLSKPLYNNRVVLAIGSKNLFDVRNVAITGGAPSTAIATAGAAHGDSGRSRSTATGRTFFVKLDINLKAD